MPIKVNCSSSYQFIEKNVLTPATQFSVLFAGAAAYIHYPNPISGRVISLLGRCTAFRALSKTMEMCGVPKKVSIISGMLLVAYLSEIAYLQNVISNSFINCSHHRCSLNHYKIFSETLFILFTQTLGASLFNKGVLGDSANLFTLIFSSAVVFFRFSSQNLANEVVSLIGRCTVFRLVTRAMEACRVPRDFNVVSSILFTSYLSMFGYAVKFISPTFIDSPPDYLNWPDQFTTGEYWERFFESIIVLTVHYIGTSCLEFFRDKKSNTD